MAWWEGYEATRVLVAADFTESGSDVGQLISLRHPKSGNKMCCLFVNGVLQELNWFKQSYTSWFLGEYVTEDGGLYTATPVDPVFIFLPIFEEARMKLPKLPWCFNPTTYKGDDPGKFRLLDDKIFIAGYLGYHNLLSIAENCMQLVCDIKEVGSSKFFRLDDSKVPAWLYHKVCQLKQTLSTLDQNYAAREEKGIQFHGAVTDAVSVLGEYMKDEPQLKLLSDRLRIDFTEAMRRQISNFSRLLQEVTWGLVMVRRKTVRVGLSQLEPEGKQVEAESHNIRDMFIRASSRRKK